MNILGRESPNNLDNPVISLLSQCDNNSTWSIPFELSAGNKSEGKRLDDNHWESDCSSGFSGVSGPSYPKSPPSSPSSSPSRPSVL